MGIPQVKIMHAIVRMLLADSRVDASDSDNEAIRWVRDGGHDAVVRLLLADPGVDGSVLE